MDENRSVEDTPASQRLTNEDFRKLLMTPRATSGGGAHPAGSVREAMANAGLVVVITFHSTSSYFLFSYF